MSVKRRRQYDDEFKRRAVRLSYGSERTIAETAESVGSHRSLLTRWRREYTSAGEMTELHSEQTENQRLRMRIAELEEENDILKKASAYFAKHQR